MADVRPRLSSEPRACLDHESVRALVEYLAERLAIGATAAGRSSCVSSTGTSSAPISTAGRSARASLSGSERFDEQLGHRTKAAKLAGGLEPGLDAGRVRPIMESLAKRLRCEAGYWTIELRVEDASLVRFYLHRGPSAGTRTSSKFRRRFPSCYC